MVDAYVGEVRPFPYNFAPRGWATCSGQILAISQNTALFSILGTTYGGNGSTTFALPDLRGRVAIGQGQGPGLSPYALGEVTGSVVETLTPPEMPAHTHTPYTRVQMGATNMHTAPQAGDYLGRFNASPTVFGKTWNNPPLENAVLMHPSFVGLNGGNQPHQNTQPVLALNFCICIQGVFPARN